MSATNQPAELGAPAHGAAPTRRVSPWVVTSVHGVLLAGALVVAVLNAGSANWDWNSPSRFSTGTFASSK